MSVTLIIPSAGIGSRFNLNVKKQYYEIKGKSILYWTLLKLINSYKFDEIVLGVNDTDILIIEDIVKQFSSDKKIIITEGGAKRSDTVYNCLLKSSSEFVMIHDAVRPFVLEDIVRDTIKKAYEVGGAICGIYARDTVKQVSENVVEKTLPRDNMFMAHTPQCFNRLKLIESYDKIYKSGFTVTDDAEAFERAGYKVGIVISNNYNLKVTFSSDLDFINFLADRYFE